MMNWRCDVQNFEPDVKISLTRVGVTNLKKLVRLKRTNKRPIILLSTFEVLLICRVLRKEYTCQEILKL